MLVEYFKSLFITLLLENITLWFLLRRMATWKRIILIGTIASGITHPLFWFVYSKLFTDYWTYIASGEIIIVFVESIVIYVGMNKKIDIFKAIAYSAIANCVSYFLGVFIH